MAKKTIKPKPEKTKEKKTGRPSDYKPEYAQMLLDYFSEEPYKERMKKVVTKSGDVIEIPVIEATDFKSLAGFAIKIGAHRETLINWSKEYPDFFDAYKKAKDYQEHWLAINGNKGLIEQPFSIFTAKNVIGWRDKLPGEEDKININVTLADRMAKARNRIKK